MKRTAGRTWSQWGTVLKTFRRNVFAQKLESETAFLKRFVPSNGVVLDVGAAYGRFAYLFSKLVRPSGRVYCFEPGDYSFGVLKAIARLNGLSNCELLKLALSDKPGTAVLSVPLKGDRRLAPSLAHLSPNANDGSVTDEVQVTTIDTFCSSRGLARLDFIKCDVEGGEWQVFSGASAALERFRPVVLSEVARGHLQKFGHTPRELYDFFVSKRYRAYVTEGGERGRVENLDRDHNYFFVPEEKEF